MLYHSLIPFILLFLETVLICTKLMDLDISDNTVGNEGADILAEVINENQLGHMKKLNVSNCKIDFNGFSRIIVSLESNKRLELLNFSKNNLASDKFSLLKPNLINCNLKDIQLSKCKLGNEACNFNYLNLQILQKVFYIFFVFLNCYRLRFRRIFIRK